MKHLSCNAPWGCRLFVRVTFENLYVLMGCVVECSWTARVTVIKSDIAADRSLGGSNSRP